MIKRRLKIAALIVGLLLLLVLGFLAWVLYTEAGLRFAVARLPERMGKVTCWSSVMDEDRYMVKRWNEFIAA